MNFFRSTQRRGLLAAAATVALLPLIAVGGCGGGKHSQNEQRERADASRKLVQEEFQDYRKRMPSTMWSGAATAGYLPCGKAGINYLIQSSIVFYDDKASGVKYLRDVQRALQSSGWVVEQGGNNLDFRLKKADSEFHFTGYSGVSHARSWLYGACMEVDSKVANELRNRSKGQCMSTVRPKGVTSTPNLESLCSWGRTS